MSIDPLAKVRKFGFTVHELDGRIFNHYQIVLTL